MATCKNFRDLTVGEHRKLVKRKDICPKCLKSMQRIKHKEISECKRKNCDNCEQAHHPLLCDKSRGSQALMKASYETDNGDDEDQTDENDDSYFTMKDGDCFYTKWIWVSQPGGLMLKKVLQESKSRDQGIRTA